MTQKTKDQRADRVRAYAKEAFANIARKEARPLQLIRDFIRDLDAIIATGDVDGIVTLKTGRETEIGPVNFHDVQVAVDRVLGRIIMSLRAAAGVSVQRVNDEDEANARRASKAEEAKIREAEAKTARRQRFEELKALEAEFGSSGNA